MTTLGMNKIDKYAIYLRKSRADLEAEKLGEGETLARHKKILTDLAVRKSLYVEKIYQEIVSGETIEARPQIQQLIKDCYAGMYRGIIIIDVDRLSRGNQGDMQTIMDCLRYSNNRGGLLVVTPTKTYDVTHNPEDEEYMEFVLFMSRREYKTIQKRLDRGRKQAVVEGNYMGSYRPYGYDIVKNRYGRTLKPNPEEAPIVRKIFEWAANEKIAPGRIAKRLENMGVPTYKGGEWARDTVKTILSNPTYAGKVRWNDRIQIKSMVDGKLVTSRPRTKHTEQYMLYDGKHDGLVSEELFVKANERFYSDRTKANLVLKNPLAGLLVCKNCGKTLRYQVYNHQKNTAPRYLHSPSEHCKVKSAAVPDVMAAVVHGLKMYIEDFEIKLDAIPEKDDSSIAEQSEALRENLRKSEKKLQKLFDAWENELISDNDFVQRKQVNEDRIESIKKELEELERTVPEKEDYEEKIVSFSDALAALLDDSIDAGIKNEYLKTILEKIEYSRENQREFILDITLR